MEELKKLLDQDDVLGVTRSATGDLHFFKHRGVIDLFNLLNTHSDFMRGGCVADKVIGRGAALLIIKGGVVEVYARLISEPAFDVLCNHGVQVAYDKRCRISSTGTALTSVPWRNSPPTQPILLKRTG